MLGARLEHPPTIAVSKPEKVLVLDLIASDDPIRKHSDHFMAASNSLGLKYVYSSPKTTDEFVDELQSVAPDIVVLDTHGQYDSAGDRLVVSLGDEAAFLDQLIPKELVPPVWILSACDTSVTGALRGCFVRQLLDQGGGVRHRDTRPSRCIHRLDVCWQALDGHL